MNNNLTKYIAEKTIELKNVNLCLSFVQLIWREKLTMVVYNNLNKEICDYWFDPVMQDGDEKILESLVGEFLQNNT
jgi:hypothetical protein